MASLLRRSFRVYPDRHADLESARVLEHVLHRSKTGGDLQRFAAAAWRFVVFEALRVAFAEEPRLWHQKELALSPAFLKFIIYVWIAEHEGSSEQAF